MTDKNEKHEESGFTIIDKRVGAKKTQEGYDDSTEKNMHGGEARSSVKKGEEKNSHKTAEKFEQKDSHHAPLPEIDFSSFIISLSTSVYIHLGEIPDPATNKDSVNIAMAKQTIDLIAMLKAKTEGNLTKEEDKLIHEMLYDLRMRFVAVSAKNP